MKKIIKIIIVLCNLIVSHNSYAQSSMKVSEKVSLNINTNIETYFIAEKLAVEHIGNYVFSNRDIASTHQPIVYYALKEFLPWKDSPVILRISSILQQLRDIQHDNAGQIEYLLYRNPFPQKGFRWPLPKDLPIFDEKRSPGARVLGEELADSLASFYNKAEVGRFLENNRAYYQGAMKEARKHINAKALPFMEKWYGEKFAGYELYLMPGMPITPGEDNYRAFGPMLTSPKGKVAAMVFSSSVQLPLLKDLRDYKYFGFDNAEVIRFLTVHEIGHSFVNSHVYAMAGEVKRDSALFTPALSKLLESSYIGTWENCIIEHLVRLGEIRTAKAAGDKAEENRLRKLHVEEFHFILLPLLEQKIQVYEQNRKKYPDFKSFLPTLFNMLHELGPAEVDQLITKSQKR